MVAIAQEPTEEPTVEVTSTEEPTAEPTDTDGDGVSDDADQCPDTPEGTEVGEDGCPLEEPTVEPTEEPTAEPTEEPTAEPTEEPTAEPTEEPTAEPTEEPTAEPTEEPTEEPTVEPTVEPTEEPTVEPTATITPTVAAAGDVGAQAIPGSWTSEYIAVQNLGSEAANVILELYDGTGSLAGAVEKNNIPVEGNVTISPNDTGFPGIGRYSGIIAANQPVAAAVVNTNKVGKVGDAYAGFGTDAIASTLVCPTVFRGHSDWQSKFHIQNASSSTQNVTVYAYPVGSGSPSDSPNYDIPANSFIDVDLMGSDFSNFGSGWGAYGYVRIAGSADLAAVCNNWKDRGGNDTIEVLYPALGDAVAGRDFVAPQVFKAFNKWNSGVHIVNRENVTTSLTISYTVSTGGSGTYVNTYDLGPYDKLNYFLPNYANLPADTKGAVSVHSADSDVLVTTGAVKYVSEGSVAYHYAALNPTFATNNIAVPVVFNTSVWKSGINVYSVGPAADITVKWVRANSDPTDPANWHEYTKTGITDGQVTFYMGSTSLPNGVPGMLTNFVGAAYISSSAPIMSLSGGTNYDNALAIQIENYNH
jgi:hypothetical protein